MKLEEWQEQQRAIREQQEEAEQVTTERLIPGALIETHIGEPAITTKYGEKDKKKLIIVGKDLELGIAYGVLIVNTRKRYSTDPNKAYSEEVLKAQIEMKAKDYESFLEYDSYINAAKITSIPLDDLLSGKFKGTLTKYDKNKIWSKLRQATTLTNNAKQRFGLIGKDDETKASKVFNQHEI